MDYDRERVQDIFDEAVPLMARHQVEVGHFQDIALNPDWEAYRRIEAAGMVWCFTVREETALIGYALYFVRPAIHHAHAVVAIQDVIYILPQFRGQGAKFIAWCDERLREGGVHLVYQHLKAQHDHGKILVRQGYELVDMVYAKELNAVVNPVAVMGEVANG